MSNACLDKSCQRCGLKKPASDFLQSKSDRNKCYECRSELKRAEYQKYKEQTKKRANDFYQRIKTLPELFAKKLEQTRNWKKQNPKKVLANTRARQMKKKQRTPKWADLNKIKEIYRNCPEGFHVDHIIPINGKNVSGLHVETNLQYLPAETNVRKSNKYEAA